MPKEVWLNGKSDSEQKIPMPKLSSKHEVPMDFIVPRATTWKRIRFLRSTCINAASVVTKRR